MQDSNDLLLEKKIKEQLKEIVRLSNLNKVIVSNAGMILITTDRDGIIKNFNNEAERMLGYDSNELIGKHSISMLIDPKELILKDSRFRSLLETFSSVHYESIKAFCNCLGNKPLEWSIPTKSGRKIPIMLSVTSIFELSDNISGFIISAIDISQQKELELSLRRSIAKEKDLNDMKSTFVATASHELRTPLATMLLASESLLNHIKKMDPDKIHEKIIRINSQLTQLKDIVEKILELSRIEAGKIEFKPQKTELINFCTQLIGKHYNSPKETNRIKFYTSFKEIHISLDHILFTTALNNLLLNAIKFSGKNSGIEITINKSKHHLSLSIIDFGIGIPEEDQKYLFTPFFRAKNASLIQGDGLGLKIVKESIEKHKGSISFQSTPGKGSTFTLHLPVLLITSLK